MGLNPNITSLLGNITSGLIGNKLAGKTKFNTSTLDSINNTVSGKTKSNLKNYSFKYIVKTLQLMIPGEEPLDILVNAVQRIILTKEYDEGIHPVLEIDTLLPPVIHKKIVKNKTECNIRLRIQKTKYSKGNGEAMASKDWINDVFQIITDDDTDFDAENEYNEVNEKFGPGGKASFNINDYTDSYILSLWKQSDIEAMRSVVNVIKNNATVSTTIADVYGKSGIKKILISPLDNDNSYPEIIIPPMNLMNLPNYLEKIYGTYYSGTTVFLDYRCLYFLSRNGVCDAKENGEYTRTVFRIPKAKSNNQYNSGTMDDATNKVYYIYLTNERIDFNAPGGSTDAISGNNVAVIDSTNNQTVAVEGVGTQRGSGNSKVSADNYSNEFNKASMLSKVAEESAIATVTLADYDEDAITPNKEFIIYFEDSKLQNRNGFYRLTSSSVYLTKTANEFDIVGSHRLVFKASIGNTSGANDEKQSTVKELNTMDTKSPAMEAEKNKSNSKVNTPGPKLDDTNTTTKQSTTTTSSEPRNNNYTYDSLGNVEGVDIPEYNRITEEDDDTVVAEKKKAQQKSLPCEGPQSKLK
jgi:hypothetical protein